MPVFALIGLVSSTFILGWSVIYSTFNTAEKIRLFALGLAIASMFVLLTDYLSSFLNPTVLLLIITLPLAVTLLYSIFNISELDDNLMLGKIMTFKHPIFLVILFFIFTFLLHFDCGLMFFVYKDSFTVMENSPFALNYFSYIPYLLAIPYMLDKISGNLLGVGVSTLCIKLSSY